MHSHFLAAQISLRLELDRVPYDTSSLCSVLFGSFSISDSYTSCPLTVPFSDEVHYRLRSAILLFNVRTISED